MNEPSALDRIPQGLDELQRLLKRLDYDAARREADRAKAVFTAKGDKLGEAWCRYYHAVIAFDLGAYTLAEEESRASIGEFEALGNHPGQAWALCNLQRALCSQGKAELSREPGVQALALFDQLGNKDGAPVAQRWLAVAARRLGRYDESRAELLVAMRAFAEAGRTQRLLECVHDWSWLEIAAGHPAEALRLQHYLIRHSQSPRWAVINVMSSVGKLEAQPERLPEFEGSVEGLVNYLLQGGPAPVSAPVGNT